MPTQNTDRPTNPRNCPYCGVGETGYHFRDCPTQRKPEIIDCSKEGLGIGVKWPVLDTTSKPSNPKDIIGSDKLPLHLWPETATAMGCLGLLDGMLKYGRNNWRAVGIRASIYVDALHRHMNAWFDEGEDIDPDSGLPHLAHALACLAIIVDAQAAGKMTDDRMMKGGYRPLIETLTPHVKRLKEKHQGQDPRHYTISDSA